MRLSNYNDNLRKDKLKFNEYYIIIEFSFETENFITKLNEIELLIKRED